MDRFNLLGTGADNPLFRFDLHPGVGEQEIVILAAVVCLLLGHVVFTDCLRGRLIYNSTVIALACTTFAAAPLIFTDPLPHIALGLLAVLLPLGLCVFGGMGVGDVKLYAALAPLFGLATIALWFVAAILTILYSIPIMISTRRDAKRRGVKLPKGQRLGSSPAGPGIAYGVPVTAFLAGVSLGSAVLMALCVTAGFAFSMGVAEIDAIEKRRSEREASKSGKDSAPNSAVDGDA